MNPLGRRIKRVQDTPRARVGQREEKVTPGINSTLIRGMQWVNRLVGTWLLVSIPALRYASGAGARRIRFPQRIHWDPAEAGDVRCEWLIPPDPLSEAALLYLHGGSGVLGLYNSCRNLAGPASVADPGRRR